MTTSPTTELRDCAVIEHSGSATVCVSGPDAHTFLQSLISADIDPLQDGQGLLSLLLSPQGKLVATFRLLQVGEEYWLETDQGFAELLATTLKRYLIRVKVELSDRSSEFGSCRVSGARAAESLTKILGINMPQDQHAHIALGECRLVHADWPDVSGFDVIGPRDEIREFVKKLIAAGIPNVSENSLEELRIESGIPRLGVDLNDRTIPQEAELEREAVSFTKGCFLGQELVCRIDTRGHVNKFLRSIVIQGSDIPNAATDIFVDGKSVGSITSAAYSQVSNQVMALGYVRREVSVPATASVTIGSTAHEAHINERPQ